MNPHVSPRPERPMTPYRWLLAAALLSIMLAQMVAMALITRSQVLRAEAREAAERMAVRTGAPAPERSAVAMPTGEGLKAVRLASAP